ncbi:HEPN domain-containing protein [Paenibacillus sp. FSL H7-0942]|uniref:HEPN domain-containing protein n=1 Tax=Paenibacillus TaxID=44249 RepID=UPI00096E331A|nr:HEPN domain-containing protein [Paenibacillus amylolyticus]OMF05713.1 hypothetical protein BK129_17315 [Paenibacillus amylolyticus]
MAKINKMILGFLHYSKRKVPNEMSYGGDTPLKNLIDFLFTHPDFANRISLELTENFLCGYVSEPSIRQKSSYSTQDIQALLHALTQHLGVNRIDHWILIPLRNAYLTCSVRYKDFRFISGDFNEKTETLRKLCRYSTMKFQSHIEHLIRKSPGFFEHPILAIRIRDHNEYVRNDIQRQAFFSISFLQAIYWSLNRQDEIPPFSHRYRENKTDHMMIFGRMEWQLGTVPFMINAHCNINLDWLLDKKNVKLFDSLYQCFLRRTTPNELSYKFLNGYKFFKKAIESEERKDFFERLGSPIMNLVIACETVLLAERVPKRYSLSFLMPNLTKLTDLNPADCALLTNEMYTLRSEYVHGGTEIFHDFNDNFGPGKTSTKYIQFKRMVAKLLITYPSYVKLVSRKSPADTLNINEWYSYLGKKLRRSRGINPNLWDQIKPKPRKS